MLHRQRLKIMANRHGLRDHNQVLNVVINRQFLMIADNSEALKHYDES